MLYFVEGHLFSVVFTFATLFLVLRVLGKQRRPGATFAWILAIILIPYVGIPAYIVFGGRKLQGVIARKRQLHPTPAEEPIRLLDFDNPAENVLTSEGVSAPTDQNRIQFIVNGEDAYERICAMIEGAKTAVFLETYIIRHDDVGYDLLERLVSKAEQGLDVRVLMDSYGCLFPPWGVLRRLRKAGGHVAYFMPLIPIRRNWSLNLRNHRKLLIVDHRRAVITGMNVGKEYMGPSPDPERWVDTAVEFEGPSVKDACEIFCSDWNFASKENLDEACGAAALEPAPGGEDIAQIVASGPDVHGDPIFEAVLSSIHAARQRVWVVTPYFAPGDELFRALLIQARVGIDVRLLVPAESNHPATDLARGPYLRQLAEAGGKVYLYPQRMVHAKTIVFDECTAVTGTVNLDMRSLLLNFEVAAFVYSRDRVRTMAEWMSGLMAAGHLMEPRNPGRLKLFAEQLSFLVSPLL